MSGKLGVIFGCVFDFGGGLGGFFCLEQQEK